MKSEREGITMRNEEQAAEWGRELAGAPAERVLAWAAERFAGRLAFATSLGLEDQALTDLIARHAPAIPVFTLDTGRLFPESYELLAATERRYGVRIRIYFPEADAVERMVAGQGVDGYRQSVEARKECCRVRKVEPLRRALGGLEAWVCGLRREQAVTRRDLGPVAWDGGNGLFKINPLADWTEAQLLNYVNEQNVPVHPLHQHGFPSIGCACCTRAVAPGEDVRAGRWWWENPGHKECGLHGRSQK